MSNAIKPRSEYLAENCTISKGVLRVTVDGSSCVVLIPVSETADEIEVCGLDQEHTVSLNQELIEAFAGSRLNNELSTSIAIAAESYLLHWGLV